jgi:hypothetical protein
MALILNNYARNADGNTVAGLITWLRANLTGGALNFHASTVAYPTVATVAAGVPYATRFLYSTPMTLAQSGTSLIFTGGATVIPTTSATVGWISLYGSNSAYGFVSNSIGLPGSGAIFIFSTLNVVAGQSFTVSMNLKA